MLIPFSICRCIVVHPGVYKWFSFQQEDYGVVGNADSQDVDADQVLAPSSEVEDEANGGWYDESDFNEHCLYFLVVS